MGVQVRILQAVPVWEYLHVHSTFHGLKKLHVGSCTRRCGCVVTLTTTVVVYTFPECWQYYTIVNHTIIGMLVP